MGTVSDRHPRYEARFLFLLRTVSPFVPCIPKQICHPKLRTSASSRRGSQHTNTSTPSFPPHGEQDIQHSCSAPNIKDSDCLPVLVCTSTKMSDHHYKFNVTMTCGGCSGAIERVLKKLDGVKDYNVSLDTQTADITTADSVSYETVLEKIKKTGKTVNSGEADGVVMSV